jgi:hypothetical protein
MSSKYWYGIVVQVLGVWACATGNAQAQGSGSTFALSGVVLNAATSAPVAGATVSARPAGASPGRNAGAQSGPDGKFSIRGLPAGQYLVVPEKMGFLAGNDARNPLTVSGDLETTLRLMPWAVITGRVTDPNHEPLIGATVQLLQPKIAGGQISLAVANQVSTNDLGEYRLYSVPPGRYYLGAFYRDSASALGLRHRADGTGEDAEGVFEDYSPTYYSGVVDPKDAVAVKATPGQTVAGIDIQIALRASVAVQGYVSNMPQGGAVHVRIQPSDAQGLGTRQTVTLNKGETQFTFKSIPPGEYLIVAQAGSGPGALVARKNLLVASSPVRDLGVALQPAPSIRGAIRSAEGGDLPSGLHVALTGEDGQPPLDIPIRAGGPIAIGGLPPGSYRISVSGTGSPANLKSLSIGERELPAPVIDVEGPIDKLSVVVTSAVGRLDGTVADSSGNPVASGLVIAASGASAGREIHMAPVGDGGKFDLGALPPGDYRVIGFSDVDTPGDLTPEALDRTDRDGQKITLSDKDKKSLTLTAVRFDSN